MKKLSDNKIKNKNTKQMKRLSIIGIIALLSAGCNNNNANQNVAEKQPVEVLAETVYLQDVDQTSEYTGTIEANVVNMISSQVAMRIDKYLVEVGDAVQKGQLLVEMEPTNYLQTRLQLENLKVDYGRTKALYESGGVAQQQVDQLKTQLDVTEEVAANLKVNTSLTSPVSGIVTQRQFNNGDLTGGQPVLQVQQLNPLKIKLNVEENNFPFVKQGMNADVFLDIYPDEVFSGKVSLIYPTIDPVSHTFVTEVRVENGKMKIRPGMFARIRLSFGIRERIVAPDKAVIKQNGVNDKYIYVINPDNSVSYRKVELGRRMADRYEILSGLNEGDRVVTGGMSRLLDGDKVIIKTEK
jgi:RND family efflux transporter MFP subunit